MQENGIDPSEVYRELTTGQGERAPVVQQLKNALGPQFLDQTKQVIGEHLGLHGLQSQAFDRYESLAGEVEARNAAERWEQGQGGTGLPTRTTGYPRESQIVTFGPGGRQATLVPLDHNPFGDSE